VLDAKKLTGVIRLILGRLHCDAKGCGVIIGANAGHPAPQPVPLRLDQFVCFAFWCVVIPADPRRAPLQLVGSAAAPTWHCVIRPTSGRLHCSYLRINAVEQVQESSGRFHCG
jgi:hypothetical protein